MTKMQSFGIDLSVSVPLDAAVSENRTLAAFPNLRAFRAKLGATPLVKVPGPAGGAEIFAKYEFANPFGSVKDRTAYSLVCRAVNDWDRQQQLKILDASGGNMARALAKLGELMKVPVRVVVPGSAPKSLLRELHESGAEVDLADPAEFLLGIISLSEDIARREPSWMLLSQHRNTANIAIHEFVTGREIIGQLDGRLPACWIAAVGSGGTLTGVSRALRARHSSLDVVAVSPAELPYGTDLPPNGEPKFAGAGGFGYGIRQPFVEKFVPKLTSVQVSYAEALSSMVEFRKQTGTKIGASSAANWITSYRIAQELQPEDIVVTLFADAGSHEDWEKTENRSG